MKLHNRLKNQWIGVTLIELLIVISIVGVIAGIGFHTYHESARRIVMEHAQKYLWTILNAGRAHERDHLSATAPDWIHDWKRYVTPYISEQLDTTPNSPFLTTAGAEPVKYFFDIDTAGTYGGTPGAPVRVIIGKNQITGAYKILTWNGLTYSGSDTSGTPGQPPDSCQFDTECDNGNLCRAHTCASGTCSHPDIAHCDDGNICNGTETCNPSNGACIPGTPNPNCCNSNNDCPPDNLDCTDDVCNPINHQCEHNPIPSCCNSNNDCPPDNNACTDDVCNQGTHQCEHNLRPGCCTADPGCNDNVSCTVDHCVNNACTHAPDNSLCLSSNPCKPGICNLTLGCQFLPAQDGYSCSDNNICNGAETCLAGACKAGTNARSGMPCDNGDSCRPDSCNGGGLCINSPLCAGGTGTPDTN